MYFLLVIRFIFSNKFSKKKYKISIFRDLGKLVRNPGKMAFLYFFFLILVCFSHQDQLKMPNNHKNLAKLKNIYFLLIMFSISIIHFISIN